MEGIWKIGNVKSLFFESENLRAVVTGSYYIVEDDGVGPIIST